MLKHGLFITPRGSSYNFYEVETTGFYRFDLVDEGASFHVDVDAVIYSTTRKKKNWEYGERKLYDEYASIMNQATTMRGETKMEAYWENGQFIQKSVKEDKAINFQLTTTTINGILDSYTLVLKGYVISIQVLNKSYDVKVDPMNFSEYSEIKLQSKNDLNITTPYYPLDILRGRYNLEHIFKENYSVVETTEELESVLKLYRESPCPMRVFDTETTGLDINLYGSDKMVGIILGWSKHDAAYIPYRMKYIKNMPLSTLKEVVDTVNSKADINIAHNKKFDIQVMLSEGYRVRLRWCTLVFSCIIDPVVKVKGRHELKTLVFHILHLKYLELNEIFLNSSLIDFSVLDKMLTKIYACPDGTNPMYLFEDLMSKLSEDNKILLEYECVLADMIADQEYYGMRVDVKEYMRGYENCTYILETLLKAFSILTASTGNINSIPTLRDIIYNKMHCKVLSRTKTGEPSVSSAAIRKLAYIQASEPNPITQDIVDLDGDVVLSAKQLSTSKYPALLILDVYKKYAKLKTAYYSRFERTMKTGRVFFWVNQNGTESGRMSSPMHQLPSKFKDYMLSDTDDHAFWGPDYSQVELRMLAYLAGQKDLISMCEDARNDIHRVIGSQITGKEMWQITPEERSAGKRRNFGAVYLISGYGLAGQIHGPGYTYEQVLQCEKSLNDLFTRYPRINMFILNNKKTVVEKGYAETALFHRRRPFPELFDPDITKKKKASLIRQANNHPVQGTAADMLKIGLVNIWKYIHAKGWDEIMDNGFPRVRCMLSIHDEVLLSCDKTIPCEEIIQMITECMEIRIKGAPPFFIQPAFLLNWGGHSDDARAMPIPLRDSLIENYKKTGKSVITYDNYMNVLDDFRDGELEGYMADLIEQYGPDYTEVGKHVKHPSLTFELLDRFSKKIDKSDLSHEEKIIEATRLYMSGEVVEEQDEEKVKSKTAFRELLFEEVTNMVQFDKDGNAVFDEDDDEEEYSVWDDEDYILNNRELKESRVWQIGDAIMVDMGNLIATDANKVIQHVWKHKDEDGFFRVLFLYDGKTLIPGIHVESMDVEELSDTIIEMEGRYAS